MVNESTYYKAGKALIKYGSGNTNMLNPGTPPLPLIVAFAKAIRLATTDLDKRENFVRRLNDKIVNNLKRQALDVGSKKFRWH